MEGSEEYDDVYFSPFDCVALFICKAGVSNHNRALAAREETIVLRVLDVPSRLLKLHQKAPVPDVGFY